MDKFKINWIDVVFTPTTGKRSNMEYIMDILENIYDIEFETQTVVEAYVNKNDLKFEAILNMTDNKLVDLKNKINFLDVLDRITSKYGFTYILKFLNENKYIELMSKIHPE